MAYRTTPLDTSGLPPGIPHIVGNEAAERFSFYGMKAILTIFMAKHLADATGQPAPMSEADAKQWFHLFDAAAYFFPIIGAVLSDALWGKYRTIVWISLLYCLGHLALAVDHTRTGLFLGLALIAMGAGGVKPCVSAHVGDQFGPNNQHLLERVYGWFYAAINLGAFASTLLTPWLLEHHGPALAFGVPGVLMGVATAIFWAGRNRFAHIPPVGPWRYFRDTFDRDGLRAVARLLPLYPLCALFWALYDQTGSSWVLQAEKMDRSFLGVRWLSSQIQAVNPALILTFIPLFSLVIFPAVGRVVRVTPLRKVGAGFVLCALSFLLTAWVEQRIEAGETPNIGWQLLAFAIITAAEVLVSVTFLEFSYTQAPNRMKSLVMGLWWLSVSAGNLLVAAINAAIERPDGSVMLEGPAYYLFFAAIMAVGTALYVPLALRYREQRHVQGQPG